MSDMLLCLGAQVKRQVQDVDTTSTLARQRLETRVETAKQEAIKETDKIRGQLEGQFSEFSTQVSSLPL